MSFAAPADTTLEANTDYFFVLYTTGAFDLQLTSTLSDLEDAGNAAGWSIFNWFHSRHANTPDDTPNPATPEWDRRDETNAALKIRVNGHPLTTPVVRFSHGTASAQESDAARGVPHIGIILDRPRAASITIGLSVNVSGANRQTINPTHGATNCLPGRDFIWPIALEQFTVPPWVTTQAFVPTICGDEIPEGLEYFSFTMQTGKGYTVGFPSKATYLIVDDDTAPAPANLGTTAGNETLDLSWAAPEGTLNGYNVHYTSADAASVPNGAQAMGSDPSAAWVDANHTRGTTPSHRITNLDNGTAYRVRVRAVSYAGNGAWAHATGAPQAPAQSSDATLSALAASVNTNAVGTFAFLSLSPNFSPSTTGYSATVPNVTTHAKLTPTVAQSAATVTVGGTSVTSGTASTPTALSVGDNVITVRVTAQDSTTKDYTVTITRQEAPIVHNTKPTVSLSASPNPVLEGNPVAVTATLSRALPSDVTIPVRLQLGEVTETGDVGTLNSITIAAGSTTGAGTLTTTADADSGTEVFTIGMGQLPATVSRGIPSTVRVIIFEPSDFNTAEAPRKVAIRVQEANASLAVTWAMPIGNPTDYNVEYRRHGQNWTVAGSPDRNAADQPLTKKTITGLLNGLTYQVRVQAVNDAGSGPWSNIVQGTPIPPPSEVNGLTLVPHFKHIKVAWNQSGGETDYYDVQYRAASTDDPWNTRWGPVTGTTSTIFYLNYSTTYEVRVRGVNALGAGPWAEAQATTYPAGAPSVLWLSVVPELAERPDERPSKLYVTIDQPAPAGGIRVPISTNGGTATYGSSGDWYLSDTSPTIPGGATIISVDLTVVDDAVSDSGETVILGARVPATNSYPHMEHTRTLTIRNHEHSGVGNAPGLPTAGVTVTADNPLAVAEDETATYTVVLDSKPTADVTVRATSSDAGAATVSPASHTFTASTWDTAATFTVSGVADNDTNDETVGISHRVTSDDTKYSAVLAARVPVSVSDTTPDPHSTGDGEAEQTPQEKYADLIARVKKWRNDPCCVHNKEHTDRWDRVLKAFGETVADTSLTAMPASEAQGYADRDWERWVEVAQALRELEPGGQDETPNRAPTVSSAIGDITIVNENGTQQVSLSGVFNDADNDSLSVTAASSDDAKATVSVATDGSSLTVTAKARGKATITVTAKDGRGGTVSDTFYITVKATPVVASALADISEMTVDTNRDVSLSGVFRDADGDNLTITTSSSEDAKATVTVATDQSKLTLAGVAQGTTTITVTARDSDGNRVSDAFEAEVVGAEAEVDHGDPAPVANLRCIAETGRVAFLWDAPQWSGGEVYAYDYDLTLPGGRSESGRLIGITLLQRMGDYQAGSEASFSVETVYETADGKEVRSVGETLTCTVGG